MENSTSSFLVCFSFGTFFLLLLSQAKAENKTEPRRNPNLSPFEGWRSAYFCLKNTSSSCSSKDTHILTLSGLLSVQDSEISDYCSEGCYQHTLKVMQCIQDVKREFTFESKAPLSFVRNATVKACTDQKGFNTTYNDPNSATSLYGRLYLPLASTLTTMAFIASFNM